MYDDNERDIESAMLMRVGRSEEWIKHSERRIQILEENDKSFEKLASTLELIQQLDVEKQKHQMFVDKQNQAQTEKFSNTLERMNLSFNRIDESMQQLYTANRDIIYKIDNIETDVAGVKAQVQGVNDKVAEMEQDDNINWKKGVKTLGKAVLMAMASGVGAYILLQFGVGK